MASLQLSIASHGGRARYPGATCNMGRRQSSQSRWTGNPSEARRRRQLLTTLTHNRYLVRRTRYTVGGHTANTDTHVISGGRRGSVVLAGERTPGKAAAVTRERGEVARAACSLARAVSCTWAAPGQRENTETVAKQKQLPSAGLVTMRGARAQKITWVLTIKSA